MYGGDGGEGEWTDGEGWVRGGVEKTLANLIGGDVECVGEVVGAFGCVGAGCGEVALGDGGAE